MIKAIIFDFDDMLYLEKKLFSKALIEDYNIPKDSIIDFLKNEYKQCRIGKMDTKEALQPYLQRFKWNGDIDNFLNTWIKNGTMDENMVKLIKEIKEKSIICILSTNNERYKMESCIEEHRLDRLFDHLLLSYELGFVKPDEKMLQKILEVTKIDKKEILFCDDKPEFIDSAKKFGFSTHHYHNIENFKKVLKEKDII